MCGSVTVGTNDAVGRRMSRKHEQARRASSPGLFISCGTLATCRHHSAVGRQIDLQLGEVHLTLLLERLLRLEDLFPVGGVPAVRPGRGALLEFPLAAD